MVTNDLRSVPKQISGDICNYAKLPMYNSLIAFISRHFHLPSNLRQILDIHHTCLKITFYAKLQNSYVLSYVICSFAFFTVNKRRLPVNTCASNAINFRHLLPSSQHFSHIFYYENTDTTLKINGRIELFYSTNF